MSYRKIKENLIGKKFGLLTVKAFDNRKGYRDYWKCLCFCGNYTSSTASKLKGTLSCGCRRLPLFEEGQEFGALVVLGEFIYNDGYEWLCKCNYCGCECFISENYLRSNVKSKSCGCKYSLIGKRFDLLTVIEQLNSNECKCSCSCGKEIIVAIYKLKQHRTSSCGCDKIKELERKYVGKKYENLEVICLDNSNKKKRQNYWKCLCDCGNYTVIPTNKLGTTKSCGCEWKKSITIHGLWGTPEYSKYLLQDPKRKLKHRVSCSIRESLKAKGCVKGGKTFDYLPYTVEQLKQHLEALWEPWMNWDNYGGNLKNKNVKNWHIDHIIPHSSFKYKSMDEQSFKECWALLNLRPLEKLENVKKHDKIM